MTPLNLLLITTDQQHPNLLGCLNPELKTPHLDDLSRRGCLFTRAYCPNPTCTPTRASIITGLYPSQHGAYSLGTKLPEHLPTLGSILQRAGYRTALVGKAHFQPLKSTDEHPSLESYPILHDLDFWKQHNEPFYGFEHIELCRNHVAEAHAGQHYALWLQERGCTNWREWFFPPTGTLQGKPRHWPIPEGAHYNTFISERTNTLLERYAERKEPFFLWASFPDPHPPYMVPEPWASMYDPSSVTVPTASPGEHLLNPWHLQETQKENPDFTRWRNDPDGNSCHGCASHLFDPAEQAKNIATYYAMMSFTDHHIGIILDRLQQLGLRDNTLILFTSDHGHFYGQHGLIAKGPFHYEDLVRVPFLAHWPGVLEGGTTRNELLSLVDLAPTLLAASGLPVPRTMAGKNFVPHWHNQSPPPRQSILVENRHQPNTLHANTYINQRYKLTIYNHTSEGEMFDLQTDPGETHNLWNSTQHADLKTQLLHQMALALMEKDPTPMPRIAPA